MNFIKTDIPDVIIIEPKIYGDHRGYFFESFNQKQFETNVKEINFVQDNESKSSRGVIRGLHFQKPPYTQAKLVRCLKGCVLDVAVDIRVGSPTYGQHVTVELSEDNKRQLFIPRGFAHGYLVVSEEAIFAYKVDNWYKPEYDSGIMWNDIDLGIDWQLENDSIRLSERDLNQLVFRDLQSPFNY